MMTHNDVQEKPVVLVTGCSGLLGKHLVEDLQDEYRVVGFDVTKPEDTTHLHWIECDLTDDASVAEAFREFVRVAGNRIASVVHMAAYYDFSGEPSPLYRQLTIDGTRRMLRALQALEVEQFLFTSTLLVMKSADDYQRITMNSPVDAEWDYPQSKLVTELFIREEHGMIPTVILRLAGVYDEDGHSVPLAQQIARIYEQRFEGYFFPGDKTHGQSFIHIADTVDCIRAAIQRRKTLPEETLLIIGEEDVMSYGELQERLGELIHGHEWPTIWIPKTVAKAGAWVKEKMASGEEHEPFIKPWMIDLADQNYPVSLRDARELLNWEPRHTLRETIPEMVKRLKKDPVHWYQVNGLEVPEAARTE